MLPDQLSIARLRSRYLRGETTPREVLAQLRERITRDRSMNIWITVLDAAALRPYLERLQAHTPEELPLWGIPFAIKDNIDLAGVETTAACPDFAYTPTESAWVVDQLIDAGAIPLGKTNLDQFATGLVGTRSPYGECHNALDPTRISGGSSSGSAVAVARGHVAFALGTDTAGSGRVPAMLNGLVGFKPAPGEWSVRGVVPACESLDCVSAFAHTVEDARLLDAICSREDPHCVWYSGAGDRSRDLPAKLVIPSNPLAFFGDRATDYEEAWHRAVECLCQTGIPVRAVDCSPLFEAARLLYEGPFVAERHAGLGAYLTDHADSLLPVTRQIICADQDAMRATDLFQAMHRVRRCRHQADRILGDAVLVLPTAGGSWTRDQVRADPIGTNSQMGLYTNHCNLLGQFALAVPLGEAAPGLPFGVTAFARPGHRGAAIALAELLAMPTGEPWVDLAVCGLHMRGFALEAQMRAHGAHYLRTARTAPHYSLYRLPTLPPKPGLVREAEGGAAVEVEVWRMPLSRFGGFCASVPEPLGIGSVLLEDGGRVKGFLCEPHALAAGDDITGWGGWRYAEAAAREPVQAG